MTINAQSADGVIHQFPDDTPRPVIDKAMRQYATEQRIKSGSFTGAAETGLASGVLGAPGAIESLGRTIVNALGGNVSPESVLPTPGRLAPKLAPFPEEVKAHPVGEATGEALSALFPAAPLAAKGVKAATNALSSAQAIEGVRNIGAVTDTSKLGARMVKDVRGDYDALYAARAKALEQAAPSSAYVGASSADQAAMNAARSAVYRDPKFARLSEFEQSPLGQQILRKTSKYSPVPKLDPAQLPRKAFTSKESVNQLRDLLGKSVADPQAQVENYASEYVATHLSDVTRGKDAAGAAKAAESWIASNRSWLNTTETPITKTLADHYVARLTSVAKRQKAAQSVAKVAKIAGTGAAMGAGGYEGYKYFREFMP